MRLSVSKAALVIFSLFLVIGCLEVVARIIDGIPVFSRQNYVSLALNSFRPPGSALSYDSRIGWIQSSYASSVSQGNTFTTGKSGIRMPTTVVRDLMPGGVLAIGDSFTVGAEVSDGETWPAQLECPPSAPMAQN